MGKEDDDEGNDEDEEEEDDDVHEEAGDRNGVRLDPLVPALAGVAVRAGRAEDGEEEKAGDCAAGGEDRGIMVICRRPDASSSSALAALKARKNGCKANKVSSAEEPLAANRAPRLVEEGSLLRAVVVLLGGSRREVRDARERSGPGVSSAREETGRETGPTSAEEEDEVEDEDEDEDEEEEAEAEEAESFALLCSLPAERRR